MKTEGRRSSSNVEDRRRGRGKGIALGGGLIAVLIVVGQLLMGGDPQEVLQQVIQQQEQIANEQSASLPPDPESDKMAEFISVAMAGNEDVWKNIFQDLGKPFVSPTLILFSGATSSACGEAQSSIGPFYCPADQKIYIDLSFFEELSSKYGAKKGDFAMAYVLAHEFGHHIQHILGTNARVRQLQQNSSSKEANRLSVAMELQADFYAGLWAHYDHKMFQSLEQGDIEEALSAASAVGDDHLQKKGQGYVVPDAFTHGTSAQRMYWFDLGYKSGDFHKGDDTFKGL